MCNTLEVPHVEARLDPRSADAGHVFSLNVHPQASQLGRVYLDILGYFGWTKFCVVYGEHSGQSLACTVLWGVYTIRQTSSKLPANLFKIHVLMLDVCWIV